MACPWRGVGGRDGLNAGGAARHGSVAWAGWGAGGAAAAAWLPRPVAPRCIDSRPALPSRAEQEPLKLRNADQAGLV
jgi:hypothetical protein